MIYDGDGVTLANEGVGSCHAGYSSTNDDDTCSRHRRTPESQRLAYGPLCPLRLRLLFRRRAP
jgi:hypothetical protein